MSSSELAPFEAAVEAAAKLVQENQNVRRQLEFTKRIEIRVNSQLYACGNMEAGAIRVYENNIEVVNLETTSSAVCSLEMIGALERHLGGMQLAATEPSSRLIIPDLTVGWYDWDQRTGLMRCQLNDNSSVSGLNVRIGPFRSFQHFEQIYRTLMVGAPAQQFCCQSMVDLANERPGVLTVQFKEIHFVPSRIRSYLDNLQIPQQVAGRTEDRDRANAQRFLDGIASGQVPEEWIALFRARADRLLSPDKSNLI